jgi:hypothetical protein
VYFIFVVKEKDGESVVFYRTFGTAAKKKKRKNQADNL